MAFDFDKFVNEPCIGKKDEYGKVCEGIFGRGVEYIPADDTLPSFMIAADFHEAFEKVEMEVGSVPITSREITAFIRVCDMPVSYPLMLQGDFLQVASQKYQIVDVQNYIPGCRKLILHDAS